MMRTLLVLYLVAAASADNLGYNYKILNQPNFGLSLRPGSNLVNSALGGYNVGSGFSIPSIVGVNAYPAFDKQSQGASNTVSGFGNPSVRGTGAAVPTVHGFPAPQAVLEKEFYTFTANENDFSVPHVENQITNSLKKGLRVIFIKGPEYNGLENAAVTLAKHIAEQKTAIYVFHKQADLNSLSSKLGTINSNINKEPEVHFVKYRTDQDAIDAQKAIRSQYDALGGVSSNYNGGETPVLDFASKAPVSVHGSPDFSSLSGTAISTEPSGSAGSFDASNSSGSSGVSSKVNTFSPSAAPSSQYLPA